MPIYKHEAFEMIKMVKKKKILIALLVTCICIGFLWLLCPIMYQNNDDKFLIYMMAGYTTGAPSMETVFGGVLWAAIIALLYRVYAGITWYTIMALVVICFSIVIIIRSYILQTGLKDNLAGILFAVGIFLGTLAYFVSAIQYTMTAAYAGTAGACALLICFRSNDTKQKRFYYVISIVLLVISFNIRKQMGFVALSSYVFVLIYAFFKYTKGIVIKKALLIMLFFGATFSINLIYENSVGLSEFNEYYSIVQRWIDYPHVSIDEDEGLYKSVGWDRELYDAATEWFFLDDRVNIDSLSVINTASSKKEKTFSERFSIAKDAIFNKQMVNVQVVFWIVIILFFNILLLLKNKKIKNALVVDGIFVFFILVSIYFCFMQGRFPLRVYQALVMMYSIPSYAIILKNIYNMELISSKKMILVSALSVCFFLSLYKVYPQGSMIHELKLATHDNDREQMIESVTRLEEYAGNHTNNIYIYDYELSQPAAPFVCFEDNLPYNVFFWGGWTYNSPIYYKQLKANGLSKLKPEDLINGNTFICGKSYDEVILKYMTKRFGNVEIELVDRVGDVLIYRYKNNDN